ncbi:MAG: sugar phosphate isomerase/epimerase family protein [Eubacteriales bacterium]|nr:sugar phosphate isomerase/epimerase family protein [Eubacteriales bacterium]
MARPVTIMTGQWADLPLEEMCKVASEMGYEGLEIASWGQINLEKAATDEAYVKELKATLEKYGLGCWAIAAHLPGQCVGDAEQWAYDPRLDGFAPANMAGKPEEIREWGIQQMKFAAQAAKNIGAKVVTGFMGSPIWKMWYSFPQTSEEQVEAGFQRIKELWTPILDVFDECGVKFALEVHPTEIAFDYWSTQKLLEVFDRRPALGINFDPSHLIWQGVDPAVFLYDFMDRVYHVHIKDSKVNLNGRNGILGSHITFGDQRRGWNFVSPGHGDVDFDNIIRVLNQKGYDGPLSIEWEDSGMERVFGASEACEFTKQMNFSPSNIAFDDALKTD